MNGRMYFPLRWLRLFLKASLFQLIPWITRFFFFLFSFLLFLFLYILDFILANQLVLFHLPLSPFSMKSRKQVVNDGLFTCTNERQCKIISNFTTARELILIISWIFDIFYFGAVFELESSKLTTFIQTNFLVRSTRPHDQIIILHGKNDCLILPSYLEAHTLKTEY